MSLDLFDGHIDPESLSLIIELQLQDVRNLIKGKGRQNDAPRDLELAVDLYRADLESLTSFAEDRALTRSIARAVLQDEDAIAEHLRVEQQARDDRRQALARDAGALRSFKGEEEDDTEDEFEQDLIDRLKTLYVDDGRSVVSTDDVKAESSSWAATRKQRPSPSTAPPKKPPQRTCVACRESFPPRDVSQCPCSHEYCRACISELFRSSIVDESLYPPRCCTRPILLEAVRASLSAQLVGEFEAKAVEYATPNRTYCYRPKCSAFIPPTNILGDLALCVKCTYITCATCKNASHDEDCPEDPTTQELLRVAAANGWQRCRSCKRMVELNTGCNHMTCRCGAQFCYVCGVEWKQCPCPQWREERLLERAEDVVDRDAGAGQYDPNQRGAYIAHMARNLRENHECVTHTWKSRQGAHRCEECNDYMPQFIYECVNCRTLACRRCRYNRL